MRSTALYYMLRAIKEVFTPSPDLMWLKLGSGGAWIPRNGLEPFTFFNHEWNLAHAQQDGIRPVSFVQLQGQFSINQLNESVLFDTAPGGMIPGNHWRLLSVDDEHQLVTIQSCGTFGNYDLRIPPFTVSQFDILFTGAATMSYLRSGQRMPLSEVTEACEKAGFGTGKFDYPEDIELVNETIRWADKNGKLIPHNEHPFFKKNKSL